MSYTAVSVGIFLFIIAFFTWNAPKSNPGPPIEVEVSVSQFCQNVDTATAPTFKAPADNVLKVGKDDVDEGAGTLVRDPEGCGGTRHQIGKDVTYRLIRKNVPMTTTDVKKHDFNWDDGSCHFDTAEKLGIDIPEIDKTKFKIFYPEISGEISLDRPLFSRTRNADSYLMYFIDYGLIFLLHINPDGSLTEFKGGTTGGTPETFVLADIYQDIDSNRPQLPPEALSCDTTRGAAIASGPQVTLPQPSASIAPDQLQLRHFVFGSKAGSSAVVNGWGVHCKPAVYLYPPQKQLVNVRVYPKGELSYTDPPYNPQTGWTVNANPSGSLFTMNDEPITNDYLYYESKLLDSEIQKPKTGWVIKPAEMENLFNRILLQLGLNQKEAKDFKDYWLNKLPDSPYYFVGLIEKPQRDYLETLKVTPTPETSIRFSLYFEMLNKPKEVTEPKIQTPQRSGFTLVDWGGMVKLHPGTPFTCSQ